MAGERLWILGAPTPKMERIEVLLREVGESYVYATGANGARVSPESAHRGVAPSIPRGIRAIYLVECEVDGLREGDDPPWKVIRIDDFVAWLCGRV